MHSIVINCNAVWPNAILCNLLEHMLCNGFADFFRPSLNVPQKRCSPHLNAEVMGNKTWRIRYLWSDSKMHRKIGIFVISVSSFGYCKHRNRCENFIQDVTEAYVKQEGYMNIQIHVYLHVNINVCKHTYMYRPTYMHAGIHTYIHASYMCT